MPKISRTTEIHLAMDGIVTETEKIDLIQSDLVSAAKRAVFISEPELDHLKLVAKTVLAKLNQSTENWTHQKRLDFISERPFMIEHCHSFAWSPRIRAMLNESHDGLSLDEANELREFYQKL